MLDPNPDISGKGQQRLRDANITTDFFKPDLMAQVEELNREFRGDQERLAQKRRTRRMRLWAAAGLIFAIVTATAWWVIS